MAYRVLVIRPEADTGDLLAELAARGVTGVAAPILVIEPTGAAVPDLEGYAGILATSRNGVEALARASGRRDLPVYAVGTATAARAAEAGFAEVHEAAGTAEALLDWLAELPPPAIGRLLWPSGEDVRLDLVARLAERGHAVDRVAVYRARPVDRLPVEAAAALRGGALDGVLFFSPRTAGAFVNLVRDAGLAATAERLVAHCISEAVAASARGLRWLAVRTAPRPTRKDLLATLNDPSSTGSA